MKNLGLILTITVIILVIGFPNYQLTLIDGMGLKPNAGQYRSWFNIIFITIPAFSAIGNYAALSNRFKNNYQKNNISLPEYHNLKELSQLNKSNGFILIICIIDILMNFFNFNKETSGILSQWDIGNVEKTMFWGGWMVLIISTLNYSLSIYLKNKIVSCNFISITIILFFLMQHHNQH